MGTQAEEALAQFQATNDEHGADTSGVVVSKPLTRDDMYSGTDHVPDEYAAQNNVATPNPPPTPEDNKQAENQVTPEPVDASDKKVEDITDDELYSLDTTQIEDLIQQSYDKPVEKPQENLEDALPSTPESQTPNDLAGNKPNDSSSNAGQPHTIPKPRFDEVLEENRQMREQLAYLKGKEDGGQGSQQDGKPEEPQQPSAEQQVQAIDNRIKELNSQYNSDVDKLAAQFDDGALTMVEWQKKSREIQQQANAAYNQLSSQKQQVIDKANEPSFEQVQQNINNNPALVDATEKLAQANPWFEAIPETAVDMLNHQALQRLQSQGHIVEPTVESTWAIRQTMVAIGKELGWDSVYGSTTPAGTNTPPANTGNGQQPAPGQPTAQDRKDKLDLAKSHPPSVNQAGVGLPTSSIDYFSNDALDKMSASNMSDNLSTAQIEKLLGMT